MPRQQVREHSPGPWRSFRGSRHARLIHFIETQCRAAATPGRPLLILADFQKEWIEETFADGVTTSIESIPKGNGKSTLKAAIGLWGVFDGDDLGDPQVPVIATKVSQAMKTIYNPAVRMVELNEELASRCIVKTSITDPQIWVPSTAGSMFPYADTVDGLQGLNPTIALIDEIGFVSLDSWAAISAAVGKRPGSKILAIGTPGFDKDKALWLIRENSRKGILPPEIIYKEFSAAEGCALDDEEQWVLANPAFVAGIKQREAFTSGIANLNEAQFRIYHLGQWVDGVQGWLGGDGQALWGSMTDPYEFFPNAPTWVGIDVAKVRDTSAVVYLQKRPDGRLHAKAKIWKPPVELLDVVEYLRFLNSAYDLKGVSYDKKLFELGAEILVKERLPMHETPQSPERMTPIVGNAFDLIKRHDLTHDGEYEFTIQVLNAVPHITPLGFTLEKAKYTNKIDAAVALCLAIDEVNRQKARNPLFII